MTTRSCRRMMRALAEELVRQDSEVRQTGRTRDTITLNVGMFFNLHLQASSDRISYMISRDEGVHKEQAENTMETWKRMADKQVDKAFAELGRRKYGIKRLAERR